LLKDRGEQMTFLESVFSFVGEDSRFIT